MYLLLAIGSVILSFFIAPILQSTPAHSCQDMNIRSGIFMFFFVTLPQFFCYLQTATTPLSMRLEFARKISKDNSLMYAIQRNPLILLALSMFWAVIFISMINSTRCN